MRSIHLMLNENQISHSTCFDVLKSNACGQTKFENKYQFKLKIHFATTVVTFHLFFRFVDLLYSQRCISVAFFFGTCYFSTLFWWFGWKRFSLDSTHFDLLLSIVRYFGIYHCACRVRWELFSIWCEPKACALVYSDVHHVCLFIKVIAFYHFDKRKICLWILWKRVNWRRTDMTTQWKYVCIMNKYDMHAKWVFPFLLSYWS